MNKKKTYSTEFKTKVVLEVLRDNNTANEIAKKYKITTRNINNWKSIFLSNAELAIEPSKCVAQYKVESKELQKKLDRYAKKVGQLTIEKEFLEGKLASLDLSKRQNMTSSKHKISLSKQCKLLNISRSYIYYQPVINKTKNKVYKNILNNHKKVPCYGYLKAHRQLLGQGISISVNTVAKYRKQLGIKAILAVKKPNLSVANKNHKVYSYKLSDTNINKANQVFSTDITYIKTQAGTIYMAAIIDWYTKAVLSYDVSNTMDSQFVMRVLTNALNRFGSPRIFNTDQGSQYTSLTHINKLKEKGIIISMDGKGRAIDNICIERFWRSAKCENIYLKKYNNITDARLDIDKYITFYNYHRFHQAIEYRKPIDFYESCMLKKVA